MSLTHDTRRRQTLTFGRRALLAACAALMPVGRASAASAAPLGDTATLLVAGPGGGGLDRGADRLIPALQRALPAGTQLKRELAGAADGVTGANRFEAQAAPDGATLLLLPGAALLARLVGDTRVHFDAGRMVPVLAGVAPGVMLSRMQLKRGRVLRMAVGRPDGIDLPALLALDLLGIVVQPVFGLPDAAAVDAALTNREIDAALAVGPDTLTRVDRLAAAGVRPVLSLSVPVADRALPGGHAFAQVATLPALLGAQPAGGLYTAWQATAICAQLQWQLLLLSPTPAALVALWRRAAAQAATSLANDDRDGIRLLPCPAANQFVAPTTLDPATTAALRRWLVERWHWQPA